MKNKHLVILFLLTLLIGLAVRRAPWREATFFQTNLLMLDTADLQQIQVSLPGQPALFLLRSDAGWSAEQEDRSVNVQSEIARVMLAALADMRSIRIAKTQRPDTLGFTPSTAIQIAFKDSKSQNETLTIGWETIENSQPASFVKLPRHEGIYLVNNHLRNIFSKTLADFRNQTIAQFVPSKVRGFAVYGQRLDSLFFQKNDSTGIWESPNDILSRHDDSVQIWLSKISSLQNLAFADLFDESHANETFYAKINLFFESQTQPLTVTFYHLRPLNVPEEMPAQKIDRRQLAPFVLHSSQNPTNYFAFGDTLLLRQICRPF